MIKLLEKLPQSRPYLTDNELTTLLNGSADSRYGKVKRWLHQKKKCCVSAEGYIALLIKQII